MKAEPKDFDSLEKWLIRLSTFGNGQSVPEADMAADVLKVFREAKLGVFGRKCYCGNTAITVRKIQPASTYPVEDYCFCKEHTKLIDDYEKLRKGVLIEDKERMGI